MAPTRTRKTASRVKKEEAPLKDTVPKKAKKRRPLSTNTVTIRGLPNKAPAMYPAYDEIAGAICLDDHSSTPPQRKCSRKPQDHAPRPRNQFMIYKSAIYMKYTASVAAATMCTWVGQQYRALTPEEKAHWELLAKEEKRRHALKYPDYKFKPKKREAKEKYYAVVSGVKKEVSDADDDSSQNTPLPTTPSDHPSSSAPPCTSSALDSSAYAQPIGIPSVNFTTNPSAYLYASQLSTSAIVPINVPQVRHPQSYSPFHNRSLNQPFMPMGSAGAGTSFSGGYSTTWMPSFTRIARTRFEDKVIDPRLLADTTGQNPASSSSSSTAGPSSVGGLRTQVSPEDAKLGYVHPDGDMVELTSSAMAVDHMAAYDHFEFRIKRVLALGSSAPAPTPPSFDFAPSTSSFVPGPSSSFALGPSSPLAAGPSTTSTSFVPFDPSLYQPQSLMMPGPWNQWQGEGLDGFNFAASIPFGADGGPQGPLMGLNLNSWT
ncbi:uncharacterized protein STEHIDRAFT_170971 [Stereum hirsutum FP-91666 SS1]|uniref:uncharacterized protein n=1 Tax=Stereum hirsutum (strain FP-91666) TaxID=721885 RepID=UPI000444995A|nr:uncharacterized protein STEHIDRAFT_170971 [Stereum hirsutum FP-91666 SS1]EIM82787.1 hypothetical protein STEHIDRAFT_170971 [Stereum hirsutum FP-91666 SS1]